MTIQPAILVESIGVMNEKSERLKLLRKQLGLSQAKFAEKIFSAQASIARAEGGHVIIGDDLGYKITSVFNVNPVWWETGEGNVFLTDQPKEMTQKTSGMSQMMRGPRGVTAYIPEHLIKVPLIGVNARAGFVENLDNYTEYISDYEYVVPEYGVKYDNAIAISVDGDSMEPGMQRGDRVLAFFQEISEWEYLNPGIYAVVYRNSFVIKRIMKNTLQATGQLELISDNAIHGPITVKMEDIKAIWKVTELIRRRLY